MSAPERVERAFRRGFASYGAEARVQRVVAARLAQLLARAGAPGRFAQGFEIGCGTGNLTRALMARAHFDALMLNDLVPEVAPAGFAMRAGDAMAVAWPETPDLIASASAIQWLASPEALIARAGAALAPGGWLALASFGPGQFAELAALGSRAGAPGLRGADALAAALPGGMALCMAREARIRLWFASPLELLRHLRRSGVNGAAERPWTRRDLADFSERYVKNFGAGGRVPLSYHPVWLIARKAQASRAR